MLGTRLAAETAGRSVAPKAEPKDCRMVVLLAVSKDSPLAVLMAAQTAELMEIGSVGSTDAHWGRRKAGRTACRTEQQTVVVSVLPMGPHWVVPSAERSVACSAFQSAVSSAA